jgi:hypothetical protein
MKETETNIDYEKLRKKLVFRDFLAGLIGGTHAQVGNCVNVHNATPEELIAIAKRRNINLDKYKTK